jgi:hypothetical protein
MTLRGVTWAPVDREAQTPTNVAVYYCNVLWYLAQGMRKIGRATGMLLIGHLAGDLNLAARTPSKRCRALRAVWTQKAQAPRMLPCTTVALFGQVLLQGRAQD